jgi:hypothetical protein
MFAQFYYNKHGVWTEALGSDQICNIDGRLNLENAIESAHDYARRIRKVHKYDGFAICRGSILNPTFITTIHETRNYDEIQN